MNYEDREACLQWFESDKVNDKGMLVDLVLSAWQAACEWRDSQVGEPYAYIYEFDSKQFGVRRSFSSNQWNGLNPSRCVLVYTTPPAAQINQQLVDALDLAETEMRYAGWGTPVADNSGLANAYEAVVAALAATQMRGDA